MKYAITYKTLVNRTVSHDALIEKGWSAAAIKKFLGDPNYRVKNTINRRFPPYRLFLKRRVVAAEQSKEFKQWKSNIDAWRNDNNDEYHHSQYYASIKVAESINSLNTIDDISTSIVTFANKTELVNTAIASTKMDISVTNTPPNTLKTIVLNYLRHKCSNYDRMVTFHTSSIQKLIQKKVNHILQQHYLTG